MSDTPDLDKALEIARKEFYEGPAFSEVESWARLILEQRAEAVAAAKKEWESGGDEILDYAAIVPKVTRRFNMVTVEARAEAVAAEREACAKIAEFYLHLSGEQIAAAIRSRSKPEEKP